MRKIKYLTPILGLTAAVGVAAPLTACSQQAVETKVLPYNLLTIDGVTLTGLVSGTDLTKYDTIDIPEGVKYIAVDAFNHAKTEETNDSSATFDYSTIKTLKLPSTVRGIRENSLVGLNATNVIDLTSWNGDTIQYVEFADECINAESDKNARYCKINLPEGLTIDQTSVIKSKMDDAGIPEWCFIDQTTGHISVSEGQSKDLKATTTNATVTALTGEQYSLGDEISLTLTDTFDTSKYSLEVYCQKTNSKKAIDGIRKLPHSIEGTKTVKFNPVMFNDSDTTEEQRMLACEGDTIDFDVNVICRKISTNELLWSEKIDGFKLTNVYTHVTSVTLASETYDAHLNATPGSNTFYFDPAWITIAPDNACNQDYSFKSDNEDVLTIPETLVSHYFTFNDSFGSVNVTVSSDDDPTKTDVLTINVVGSELTESATGITSDYDYPDATRPGSAFQGYTVPAQTHLNYKMKLGYKASTDDPSGWVELPEDERCSKVLVPHYDETHNPVRTFGLYHWWINQTTNDDVYHDKIIPVDPDAVTITVTKTGIPSYTLEKGTHFKVDNGRIVFLDATATGEAKTAITFPHGTEIEIDFTTANTDKEYFAGFKFVDFETTTL